MGEILGYRVILYKCILEERRQGSSCFLGNDEHVEGKAGLHPYTAASLPIIQEGFQRLKTLLEDLPSEFSYAVEFRHHSWFRNDMFVMLRDKNVALAWSEIRYAKVPAVLTPDIIYLRLVRYRSIPEEEFRKVMNDRPTEISY